MSSVIIYIYFIEKTDSSIPAFILKLPEMAEILLCQDSGISDQDDSGINEGSGLSEGAMAIMQTAGHTIISCCIGFNSMVVPSVLSCLIRLFLHFPFVFPNHI